MRLPGIRSIAVLAVLAGGAIAFLVIGREDHPVVRTDATPAASEAERKGPDQAALRDLDFQFGAIPEFADTVSAFVAQSRDPSWSDATEARIFREISQASGLGADEIQVDCRSTMCRVQLTHRRLSQGAPYEGFDDLVDTFGLKMLWLWSPTDDDGIPMDLAYLQRPLLSLPDLLFAK